MKNLTISVALVALCAITVDAFAGGHAPPQQPATGVSSRSQAQAGAISGSAARATGGTSSAASGDNTAAGGAGGTATATNGANQLGIELGMAPITAGNDSSNFRALALSMSQPAFTPPLPISGCPQANIEQRSISVVGGMLFSAARGDLITDNCTTIIIYNNLLARCKFKSASDVLDGLTKKVLAGYVPESKGDVDLSRDECEKLKLPMLPPPAPVLNLVAAAPTPVVPACLPVKSAPQKRAAKPEYSCKRVR